MSVPDPTVTDWVPLWQTGAVVNAGGEIDYVERTTPVDITAIYPSATTILTGNTITYDGLTRIKIEFFAYEVLCTTSSVPYTVFGLYEDGTKICDIWAFAVSTTGPSIGVKAEKFHIPSAGAHTYSIRGYFTGGSGLTSTVRAAAGTGGSVNHAGGPAFMRITAAGPLPGTFVPPTYGTTLPSAPLDGQEAVLVDSITNPSYQWRFRYNAGSSSVYKWECIGSTPLRATEIIPQETCTSAGWVSLATVGPQVTVPRAGEYDIHFGCGVQASGQQYAGYAPKFGAAAVNNNDRANLYNYTAVDVPVSRRMVRSLVASDVILMQYSSFAAVNSYYQNRWLMVQPVRVS